MPLNQAIIIIGAVIFFFMLMGWLNLQRTMTQAPGAPTPEAAVGRAAIAGTLRILTVLTLALAMFSLYLYLRPAPTSPPAYRYDVKLERVPLQLTPQPTLVPAVAPATPTPRGCAGPIRAGEAAVVMLSEVPVVAPGDQDQPTKLHKPPLRQGDVVAVLGGPWPIVEVEWWYVDLPDHTKGWAPATVAGKPALAPRC